LKDHSLLNLNKIKTQSEQTFQAPADILSNQSIIQRLWRNFRVVSNLNCQDMQHTTNHNQALIKSLDDG